MRVGIVSLIHESNTFISTPTTMAMFERDGVLSGDQIVEAFAGGHHEISGFLEGLNGAGIEPVPLFYASTNPSGVITAATCEQLMELMFAQVEAAGRLDGYLVAPHGANAGEGDEYRDLDGHWLCRLREFAGPDIPIVCTVDPHANLSARMVEACDATVSYRTNPHLDQKKRGLEAAALLILGLQGQARPVQAAVFPPLSINIERQLTADYPCLPLYGLAAQFNALPGVLSTSIVLGFPYADVEEMGSAAVVVTDGQPELARQLAEELGQFMVAHRQQYRGQLLSVEEAVEQAAGLEGPVCLLDMGDNVGGGSAADGTFIAHELHRRAQMKAFVCLFDPAAAEQALAAGPGAALALAMGGKTDTLHGPPLEAQVRVRSVHEGKFRESEVRHGGRTAFDMGPTAVVETDSGLTISLTSRRVVPVSLGMMTSCGLGPAAYQVIVAKGVHAPVAAFAPVCKSLTRVNTAGTTSADMEQFKYRYRRTPLFPFEEI